MAGGQKKSFPEFVRDLPKADYSSDGAGAIRGYVLQGEGHQVVFNENDEAVEFTPHRHAASFGVVLQGECELVIEGESQFFRTGDVYRVPEGSLHFARQSEDYKDIVIFNEPGRVPIAPK
jgi:mannose-6-phosphate isomerase-like protein (cupin superfamily)